MHQSTPVVPILSPVNRWAFTHVVRLGGWAFAILSRSWGLDICVPWDDPRGFGTRVLESAMEEFIGKEPGVED